MKRDIEKKLYDWKNSARRKPLILQGARQVGKTYTLKKFGKSAYEETYYFNFEEDPGLDQIFQENLNPERIIKLLSLYSKRNIKSENTLIIFDEIQESNRALNSLKYFCENAPEYHIAAAGSLLGVLLSGPRSFPVGKVNLLKLHPLTFLEFLDSIGENNLRELIETWKSFKKIPDIFHNQLIRFLKLYYFIGGMPETVSVYIQTNNEQSSRKIQSEIINTYVLDFAKHAPASDIPKLLKIWASIPGQLAKENKKFIFSAISKSARAKGYEDALNWLENSGLIYKSYQVSSPRFPLNGYANKDAFKIFILDVGLLGALSGLSSNILVKGNSLFTEFNGSFVENYIAQSLTAYKEAKLYYWTSPGIAEVDFLYQGKNHILPLEVKAGINPKSKSLSVYNEKYSPPILSRSTLLNFTSDGKICNYPLYAIQRFPELYLESLTESDSI